MSNTVNSMQGIAAAAAIAQEPITAQVRFAITGDAEVDLMAGILAVFKSSEWVSNPVFSGHHMQSRMMQRICEYLAIRFKLEGDERERQMNAVAASQAEAQRRHAEQMAGLGVNTPPPGTVWGGTTTGPGGTLPYYTTSGLKDLEPLKPIKEFPEELHRLYREKFSKSCDDGK